MENNNNNLSKIKENELRMIQKYFRGVLSEEYINSQIDKHLLNVVYKELPETLNGNYNYVLKEIWINSKDPKDVQRLSLVHELLHIVTNRSNSSRGLKRLSDDRSTLKNIGLDEIVTEEIAEEITGVENKQTYRLIRPIYTMYSKVVGKDVILRDYVTGSDEIRSQMEKRFGDQLPQIYDSINQLMDSYAVAQTSMGHLSKSDPDYDKNISKIEDIIKKVADILPTAAKMFIDTCNSKYEKRKQDNIDNEKEDR